MYGFSEFLADIVRFINQIYYYYYKFLRVDKTPGADITVHVIRRLCNFRKMNKIYMLILVSMDL